MRLTITYADTENVHVIDVANDMSVQDLKAYIEVESTIPASNQLLLYNRRPLESDSATLAECSLQSDDFVLVVQKDALNRAQNLLNQQNQQNRLPQHQPMVPSNIDPDSEEGQKFILDAIRQQAINENFESALEHNPEVFGSVTMLFVDVEVNGHKIKAFVDSGAQMTVMNPACVEKCHLAHLVDSRYQGIAQGVGTSKILGRVHSAPIKVGNGFFPCSFVVIEGDKTVDLLLGLDMLKRHQGCIDLRRNCLVFGDSEVPFLPESEIPDTFLSGTTSGPATSSTSTSTSAPASTTTSTASAASKMAAASSNEASAVRQHTPKYPPEVIENLMGLGFSRQQVIQALDAANGNAEVAAAMLFG